MILRCFRREIHALAQQVDVIVLALMPAGQIAVTRDL